MPRTARQKPADDGGYRHVLRLVVPMVLSNAAFTVMQFTDRILVARHGTEDIQAAMPAGILTFCLLSLFAATAGYAGTFVAQFHGAGDRRRASAPRRRASGSRFCSCRFSRRSSPCVRGFSRSRRATRRFSRSRTATRSGCCSARRSFRCTGCSRAIWWGATVSSPTRSSPWRGAPPTSRWTSG